jgi:hypothetical protein
LKIDEVYYKLNLIKKQVDEKRQDSFDNKKVFKFLYDSILDLLEELENYTESDELFDDDDNFSTKEEVAAFTVNPIFDDLIDD